MAGEVVYNVNRTLTGGGLSVGGVQHSVVANSAVPFQELIPAGSVKVEIDIAFALANAQAIAISSNQPCTLYTNSSGSPVDTVPVIAGKEIIWVRGVDPIGALPFSADVTKLFVSVPGATGALLKILVPVHVTPVLP